MPNTRPKKHHLWNFSTGLTVCGKDMGRFSARVTTNSHNVTCVMCHGELIRWSRQVPAISDKAGSQVFQGLLEDINQGRFLTGDHPGRF